MAGKRTASRLISGVIPAWPCSWLGLPGRSCYQLRRWSLTPPFHPYRRLQSSDCDRIGGLFLWPYPAGFPAPGVTRHHVLWSADFPRRYVGFHMTPRSPSRPGYADNTIDITIRQMWLTTIEPKHPFDKPVHRSIIGKL